jgi:hypothetical protein
VVKTRLFLFFLVFSGFATACTTRQAEVHRTVLAVVGKTELTLEQARAEIPRDVYAIDSVFALASYRDRWIREQLWYQEAARAGFANDPAIRHKAEAAHNGMVNHLYRRSILESMQDVSVSDEEVLRIVKDQQKEPVKEEEQFRILHVRTTELKTALEAKNRLLKFESMEEVVKDLALESEKTLSETTQWVAAHRVLLNTPLLKQYLKELTGTQEISPIRRIGDTFHFIKVLERRMYAEKAIDDGNAGKVKEWLLAEKRRQKLLEKERDLLLQAKAAGQIKLFIVPENKEEPEQ